MKLEAMATIISNAGVAVQGTSLFINFIPDNRPGLLLRDYFGGTPRDHELPGYIKAPFMLIGRGPDIVTVKAQVKAAVAALEAAGLTQATVGGITLNYLRGRNEPFSYASSLGQNWESTVTMDACYVDSA